MKYYIIAGEASGDLHASNLMHELKAKDNEAVFRCWGGDLMEEQGAVLVKHYRDLAFMGFAEVISNIRTIYRNIQFCKKDILDFKADAVILVDYPGFNLRIAEFAHKNQLKVIYYISPQIWAWKKSRVHKIKRTVDQMYVILPFEKDFYKQYDYEVEFPGHPLLDAIDNLDENKGRAEASEIIALLPGSRKQEISRMLPVMLKLIPEFPDHKFVLSTAPGLDRAFYEKYLKTTDVEISSGNSHELLRTSHAALVTSGTATLETALFNVPEVVCYKGSSISYAIARRIVNIKYISLVNLIMDKPVVTELIQGDFNLKKLKQELKKILDPEYRKQMLDDFTVLRQKLGGKGASKRAAESIIDFLKSSVN